MASEPKLSAKQKEYIHNATHRWNVKTGATASGKTFLDYAFVIPQRILKCAGEGLIVLIGNNINSIERNVLSPMREIWPGLVSPIRQGNNTAQIFGRRCFVMGADKVNQVARIQGTTIEYAYGDEVTTWNREFFEMLKSRLRAPNSCFDGTCNPEHPKHWFKEFLDGDADIYQQAYRLDDNEGFLPPGTIDNIKREYAGTVYYDRYVLGKWVAAAGIIYPNFNEKTHVKPTVPRDYESYAVSNDYGVQHACVFGLWGLCRGVWYLIATSFHHGEKDGQRTVEDSYAALMKLIDDRKIFRFFRDNAPIASSFNVHVRRKWTHGGLRQADNEVLAGIQDVSTALNTGVVAFNDCNKEVIAEFGSYLWDEKAKDEKPIKENDDCMDMVRYFIRSMRLAKPEKER